MNDVTSIGILVADNIAKTVNKLPEKGKLSLVENIGLYTGGCAASAAIDMAKLGLDVSIIGKIGNDGFGKFMKSALSETGVNTDGLSTDLSVCTSSSIVTVDSSGERSFLHCLGANAEFTIHDIDFNIIKNSKMVLVAGTMLMPKFDGMQCAQFLKTAQSYGCYTVLDTAWDSKNRWMNLLRPCMEFLDLFIPSIEEAEMLSGKKDPEEIADVFLGMGVKTVVIKLGIKGCFIKDSTGITYQIPAYTNIQAVDTTGAGDSFVAGFLTGLTRGLDLKECGKFANAVGAHCVMAAGASTGIKNYDDTVAFIKEHDNA